MAIMKLFTFLVKKTIGKRFESDFTNDAQPGDVVLYRGKRSKILCAGIQLFTSSAYNHVSIYDKDGWTIGAGAFGTTYENFPQTEAYDIFRLSKVDAETQAKILEAAKSKIGRAYSYEGGFIFPFLSSKRIKKLSLDRMHNCSEMVALSYKDAGKDLINIKIGQEAIIAPADIARSKKLEYIGTYYKGKLYSRELRNIYSPELQGSKTNIFAKIIIFLFKKWSKRDEFYSDMFVNDIYLEQHD